MVDAIVCVDEKDIKLFKLKFRDEYSKIENGYMLDFKDYNITLIATNILF